jgi:hypothetical protein
MMRGRAASFWFAGVLIAFGLGADAQSGRKRALLIGINDYSASTIAGRIANPAPARDWPELTGAVNDVAAMREMLVALHGFNERDIMTLTDQKATRDAILRAIQDQLIAPAAANDIHFFYFAGHGSQVKNSKSSEPDLLDESLVPADSRAGASDIRDKELHRLFNRILDRGARLTVMLDACHTASGARGLESGAPVRSVKADPRDVADRSLAVWPEKRGALILAAAEDFDSASETTDDRKTRRGAFSWAWIRAMRNAAADEPAIDTFLRAAALMQVDTPFQVPVIAGTDDARFAPFLGRRGERRTNRTVVAVENVRRDGTVIVSGGWANGLSAGSELRVAASSDSARLKVTALSGMARSEARIVNGQMLPSSVRPGALLEVVGWAAPPGRPLRVWMPRVPVSANALIDFARTLARETSKHGVSWITDPTEVTPSHLLRRSARGWELRHRRDGALQQLTNDAAAIAAMRTLGKRASLFAYLPAPASLIESLAIGPGTDLDAIEPVARAEDADYQLVGRWVHERLEYSWVRPSVARADRRRTALPLRTNWIGADAAPNLREAALRLRRILGWNLLESPCGSQSSYRLAMRNTRDGKLANGSVAGGDTYTLSLRAPAAPDGPVDQRYVYIFAIDGHGKSALLFPPSGSVENRVPQTPDETPPAEIPLGREGFGIVAPFGIDTYFVLFTDEPLPNPWILEWDGVRARAPRPLTPLEELLIGVGAGRRGSPAVAPATWSIERVLIESLPPRKTSAMPPRTGRARVHEHSLLAPRAASVRLSNPALDPDIRADEEALTIEVDN